MKLIVKHKCGNRVYWEFTATKERQTEPDATGYFETVWELEIKHDEHIICTTSFHVSYDDLPSTQDILVTAQNYFANVLIGAAAFSPREIIN